VRGRVVLRSGGGGVDGAPTGSGGVADDSVASAGAPSRPTADTAGSAEGPGAAAVTSTGATAAVCRAALQATPGERPRASSPASSLARQS